MYASGGVDLPGDNYGSDLLKNNTTRQMELGNKIGQGVPFKRTLLSFTASYMVKHNVFVDLQLVSRKNNYDDGVTSALQSGTATITSLALRWNIAPRNYDF
jgi:hypothetical protein